MRKKSNASNETWIAAWLDSVQDGTASMSQRACKSIDHHGGIDAVIEAAKLRGIHLVKLTDDKGHELIAASRHTFNTLC